MQWQATEHGKPIGYDHDPGITTGGSKCRC